MSTPYEATGRTEQKRRTRDVLVAAARDLVASGITPTVEQAGVAAAVSRPTAYRYFPNQRTLLAAAHPEAAAETLLPADAPEDPAARLAAVITTFTHMIVETESQQRAVDSLEADPAERAAPTPAEAEPSADRKALSPLRASFRTSDTQSRPGNPQRCRHRSPQLVNRCRKAHPGRSSEPHVLDGSSAASLGTQLDDARNRATRPGGNPQES